MSPDETLFTARTMLARATDDFRSALATTIDQVRDMLPRDESLDGGDPDHAALGDFASGRIDTVRFASLVVRKRALEPASSGVIERALATLESLAAQGEALTTLDVPPGNSLHAAVATALAQVGRAFGAARVIAAVRSERGASGRHESDLEGFPFARWNRAERRLAPPLLIELDGADLHAGALDEFLDGTMRLVLLVRGRAAPAPLAGLIAPGVFVLQAGDTTGLAGLLDWDGPGVAAILPEGSARFVHDPAGGDALCDRLVLEHMPDAEPAGAVGGISVAQQMRQRRLLAELSARPAATPTGTASVADASPVASAPSATGGTNGAATDPVDKLAAWLLGSADLSDLP